MNNKTTINIKSKAPDYIENRQLDLAQSSAEDYIKVDAQKEWKSFLSKIS